MTRELLFANANPFRVPNPKAGYWKLVGDGETVYAVLQDGSRINLGAVAGLDASLLDFSEVPEGDDPHIDGRLFTNGQVLMVSRG